MASPHITRYLAQRNRVTKLIGHSKEPPLLDTRAGGSCSTHTATATGTASRSFAVRQGRREEQHELCPLSRLACNAKVTTVSDGDRPGN